MSKIMLVEDDNSLREIYQARLSAEGYDIVAAQDGEEALALVAKEKPDLIILDVMMPKISGFDTLDIIRSTPNTKDIKVIMMTALSQAEDKARAEKLGADRYLVKSQVTLEDIVKAAKEVLEGENAAGSAATSSPATQVNQQGDNKNMNQDQNPATPTGDQPAPGASGAPADSSLNVDHSDTNVVSPTDTGTPDANQAGGLGDSTPSGDNPLGITSPGSGTTDQPASPADTSVQSDPSPLDNQTPPADAGAAPSTDPAVTPPATSPDSSTQAAPAPSLDDIADPNDAPASPHQATGSQRVIQPLDSEATSNGHDIDTLLANEALKESAEQVPPPPASTVVGSNDGSVIKPTEAGDQPASPDTPGSETPQTPPQN